jgi:3-deoxy-manno-octulosonate cytidylyltransferase (CMP-KDO synthetase)
MKIAIGIPARMESSRFPGKPLALLAGRPMIEHVIDKARQADLGRVFVATDDVSPPTMTGLQMWPEWPTSMSV